MRRLPTDSTAPATRAEWLAPCPNAKRPPPTHRERPPFAWPTVCRLQVAHVAIVAIHQNLPRRDRPVGQLEGDDDNLLPGLDQVRRRAVHVDDPTAPLAGDDIRLQPRAARVAHHQHLFVRPQPHPLHQLLIDCDTTHVVDVGLSDRRLVNLRTHYPSHALYCTLGIV